MILRFIVFPLGPRYRVPDDRLDAAVANSLLSPGSSRDRLTAMVYIGDDQQQTGRLERALTLSVKADPVERKIKKASGRKAMTLAEMQRLAEECLESGVVNQDEADTLLAAARARHDAIQVDSFENLRGNQSEKFQYERGEK
jgi:hypothetical protein